MGNNADDNIEFNAKSMYDSETKCPLIYALNIVGAKWKLPIMWYVLKSEPIRYNELKRQVKGITNTMLTKSLRELEEHGLIIRNEYDTNPPKVEYSLSEQGKALLPTFDALSVWGEAQMKIYKNKKFNRGGV